VEVVRRKSKRRDDCFCEGNLRKDRKKKKEIGTELQGEFLLGKHRRVIYHPRRTPRVFPDGSSSSRAMYVDNRLQLVRWISRSVMRSVRLEEDLGELTYSSARVWDKGSCDGPASNGDRVIDWFRQDMYLCWWKSLLVDVIEEEECTSQQAMRPFIL
jgi:hypothetical protein